jgi:hypothetical protein
MVGPFPLANPSGVYFNATTDPNFSQQADKLTTTMVVLQIPWWSYKLGTYVVQQVTSMEIWNQNQSPTGDYCMPNLLVAILSLLQALQVQLVQSFNAADAVTQVLHSGDNFITTANIASISLDLVVKDASIDYWYGSTIIRKLGVLMWGYPRQDGELVYINSTKVRFAPDGPGCINGAVINLPPGVTGTATIYPMLDITEPGPIMMSTDGGNTFAPVQLGGNQPPYQFPS